MYHVTVCSMRIVNLYLFHTVVFCTVATFLPELVNITGRTG